MWIQSITFQLALFYHKSKAILVLRNSPKDSKPTFYFIPNSETENLGSIFPFAYPFFFLFKTDVRRRALREMCPCRVKQDLTDFWKRVLEMTHDPDPIVRQQVHLDSNHYQIIDHLFCSPRSTVRIRSIAKKCAVWAASLVSAFWYRLIAGKLVIIKVEWHCIPGALLGQILYNPARTAPRYPNPM